MGNHLNTCPVTHETHVPMLNAQLCEPFPLATGAVFLPMSPFAGDLPIHSIPQIVLNVGMESQTYQDCIYEINQISIRLYSQIRSVIEQLKHNLGLLDLYYQTLEQFIGNIESLCEKLNENNLKRYNLVFIPFVDILRDESNEQHFGIIIDYLSKDEINKKVKKITKTRIKSIKKHKNSKQSHLQKSQKLETSQRSQKRHNFKFGKSNRDVQQKHAKQKTKKHEHVSCVSPTQNQSISKSNSSPNTNHNNNNNNNNNSNNNNPNSNHNCNSNNNNNNNNTSSSHNNSSLFACFKLANYHRHQHEHQDQDQDQDQDRVHNGIKNSNSKTQNSRIKKKHRNRNRNSNNDNTSSDDNSNKQKKHHKNNDNDNDNDNNNNNNGETDNENENSANNHSQTGDDDIDIDELRPPLLNPTSSSINSDNETDNDNINGQKSKRYTKHKKHAYGQRINVNNAEIVIISDNENEEDCKDGIELSPLSIICDLSPGSPHIPALNLVPSVSVMSLGDQQYSQVSKSNDHDDCHDNEHEHHHDPQMLYNYKSESASTPSHSRRSATVARASVVTNGIGTLISINSISGIGSNNKNFNLNYTNPPTSTLVTIDEFDNECSGASHVEYDTNDENEDEKENGIVANGNATGTVKNSIQANLNVNVNVNKNENDNKNDDIEIVDDDDIEMTKSYTKSNGPS